MRWWLNTDAPCIFSVDNAAASGMDFSSLTTDIWMVQWTDGRGEIERQTVAGTNLNGLRETFIDVIPYCPLFQQFLTRLQAKGLLLPQAKKVQIELIGEVFNSKRQAPFHYPVAAGDYYWDATDETLYSSTASGLQNTTATLNNLIDSVNAAMAQINAVFANVESQTNGQFDNVNVQLDNVNNQGNSWATSVNINVVDPGNNAVSYINTIFSEVNQQVVAPGDNVVAFINSNVLPYIAAYTLGTSEIVAAPGRSSAMSNCPVDFVPVDTNPYTFLSLATMFALGHVGHIAPGSVSWTDVPHVAVANAQWIPIGGTVPVNVTPAEQAAIMSGIAARAADLNVKKNVKIGQVNALTTIPAVIAYDVTTGW